MRIAIYLQVSTDKQDCENQARQLRMFAKMQGWQIVCEYTDSGESGAKRDRSALKQMFEDASRRKFDLILFWAFDRLSRESVLPTLRYLERLTACGVEWRSFTEQFFDSCGPFRDAVISIFAHPGETGRHSTFGTNQSRVGTRPSTRKDSRKAKDSNRDAARRAEAPRIGTLLPVGSARGRHFPSVRAAVESTKGTRLNSC